MGGGLSSSSRRRLCILETVFMHDPVGPLASWGPSSMEDEGLLHADDPGGVVDRAILACGLPVALGGGPVGAGAVGVLAIEGTEEVPHHVAGPEAGEGGEVPWLPLVQIDLGDGIHHEGAAAHLALQVVADQLLVGGLEPEARSSREAGVGAWWR